MKKYFGVNLAGGDFGTNLPGTKGVDYIYPTNLAEYQYYASKKLLLFRIPIKWERLQRSLLGSLNTDDVTDIKTCLDNVQKVGGKAIIELHNYGIYGGQALTVATAQNLADVWTKLAQTFGTHPALFGYELMNEPHDLPDGSAGWKTITQATVNAIRTVDKNAYILAAGYDWQSADRWPQSNADFLITDPANKLLYAAHCYFDGDASGQYWWGNPDKTNGTGRVQHFLDWLKTNNAQGIITEYGVPFGPTAVSPLKIEWFPVLDDFLNTLNTSDQIIGGTAWSGGPWWGEYTLTIEPTNNFTDDRPVMTTYQKYPTTVLVPITPVPTTPETSTPSAPVPTTTAPPVASDTTSTQKTELDIATLNQLITDGSVILKKLRTLFSL